MSSPIVQIENAIVNKIATDFRYGYSALNLTGKVIVGEVTEPPEIPFATVQFVDFIEDHGQTLGRYRGDAEFNIICYCAGDTVHVDSRRTQAINLASDIVSALTADRFLGLTNGIVDDVRLSFLARDGDKYGIPNIGIAYIRILVTRQTDTGA